MSEELLEQFIANINEEDGIYKKEKKKSSNSSKQKDAVKRLLNAASKGQVELPDEEAFIVEKVDKKKTNRRSQLSDKLAAKGFSLVEQVRAERPDDLLKRNLKYMKFSDKRKLDVNKAGKIIDEHMRSLVNKTDLRRGREKITCLRDPKIIKGKKKDKSVFSDKDFLLKGNSNKKLKKKQNEDGTFL